MSRRPAADPGPRGLSGRSVAVLVIGPPAASVATAMLSALLLAAWTSDPIPGLLTILTILAVIFGVVGAVPLWVAAIIVTQSARGRAWPRHRVAAVFAAVAAVTAAVAVAAVLVLVADVHDPAGATWWAVATVGTAALGGAGVGWLLRPAR